MSAEDERFYIVSASVLPEVLIRTVQAKELLARGAVATVNEATSQVGLSRSAYYKYKDGIFHLYTATQGQIVTISMHLEHRAGMLSRVLSAIALVQGNILTINQGIPLQGLADVTVSLETADLKVPIDELLNTLKDFEGVKTVDVVGRN